LSAAQTIYGVARADFLERVRRHSFLVTLLFAVYLAYATAKGQISLRLDEYRGVYTSAWIGTLVAMVSTIFVSLTGFYIVKNSVDRDRMTGVGQILAATPIAKPVYAAGKFLSNFAVLGSMVGVLAFGALIMQFFVAEDSQKHLWALLAPFLLIALPMMALTASIAIFFEMVPALKGGLGNVIWFFVWTFGIASPKLTGLNWFDPAGIVTVMDSLGAQARRYVPGYKGGIGFQINLGQIQVAHDLRWYGISWTWQAVLLRLMWFGVAIGLVLVASIIFDRFDSARAFGQKLATAKAILKNGAQAAVSRTSPRTNVHLTPLLAATRQSSFGRIFSAELRLALQGIRWWGYAVAAGLLIAEFVAPIDAARGPILGTAWMWCVLLWSASGSRESRFGVRQILFSCPNILPRQWFACWLAGVFVALLVGSGALSRLIVTGQTAGAFAVLSSALFIPAMALAAGIITSSGKLFEALFTMLWYVGPMNHTVGLDFTGAGNGAYTLHYATSYLVLAALLLLASYFARARQLRGN
jgi:hypothetical protein